MVEPERVHLCFGIRSAHVHFALPRSGVARPVNDVWNLCLAGTIESVVQMNFHQKTAMWVLFAAVVGTKVSSFDGTPEVAENCFES